MKAKEERLAKKSHALKKSRAGHEEHEFNKRLGRKAQTWRATGEFNSSGKEIYVPVHS